MSPEPEAVRRFGVLTDEGLRAAIADEQARGRTPHALRVGHERAYALALRILTPTGGLELLVAGLPRVEVDAELPSNSWVLLTLSETAAALR